MGRTAPADGTKAADDLGDGDLLRGVAAVAGAGVHIRGFGDTIVRGAYDGEFDKTNLPDEVVLSNYFSVRDGKIVSLMVIFNQPAGY